MSDSLGKQITNGNCFKHYRIGIRGIVSIYERCHTDDEHSGGIQTGTVHSRYPAYRQMQSFWRQHKLYQSSDSTEHDATHETYHIKISSFQVICQKRTNRNLFDWHNWTNGRYFYEATIRRSISIPNEENDGMVILDYEGVWEYIPFPVMRCHNQACTTVNNLTIILN